MGAIARSDVELVEASLRGEQAAFGHLVSRYQDVVCAVSYSSTGDQSLSEDVAQETFIAAWRQLDRLRDRVRLRPWLCGIARNLGRKARKRRRREELVDTEDQVAPGANPFEQAASGEVERVVREALARIPDAYREVLVLYYRENQSIREVAETLGTSEAAVMQRMSRGRRYLADSVSELVERSLRSERPRRDLVAAVLGAIAATVMAPRVDASPLKGSTMKILLAATAAVAVGTTAYLVHAHNGAPVTPPPTATALHYGAAKLGLAHAPSLGPTAAPKVLQSRTVAHSDLSYLPADADAVIGLNFAQARSSALWQQYVAPKLEHDEGIRKFAQLCGFDPLASLTAVSIGVKGIGGDKSTGVIVIHGFEKAKSMSCFDRAGIARANRDGVQATIDGNVVLFADAAKSFNSAFTFIDDTTALVVVGPEAATAQGVHQIAAGGSTLATQGAVADSLQYVDTDDSLWLVLGDRSPLMAMINLGLARYAPVALGTTYVSLDATTTLALDAGVKLASPAAVASLVSTIQTKISEAGASSMLKQLFDQLDVSADGSDLIISLAMTGDQLVQLFASHTAHASASVDPATHEASAGLSVDVGSR